jgi:myo-inositol 2-dehydrogenase / D-chiro-inositol 1-dehydrogenase
MPETVAAPGARPRDAASTTDANARPRAAHADGPPRATDAGGSELRGADAGGASRAAEEGRRAGGRAGGAALRIAVVGCGGAAERLHLPALARVAGARVVALSDVDAARLARVADRFRVGRRHADFRDALAGVDAVAVCVPPRLHAEVACAALEAGRHVFVEKPLALSLAECERIAEAATRAGTAAACGFNLRFHRLAREAREAVASGALGRVKLMRTVLTSGVRSHPDFPAWRTRRGEGGGAIFELGVHHFDLARFLLADEFSEVLALWPEDETATVCARTRRGAQVVSAFCEGTGESHEVEVFGERGSLRFSCHRADGVERLAAGEYAGALGVRLRGAAQTVRALPRMLATRGGEYLASYEAEWHAFVSAARGASQPGCTLEDGRRAVAVALAAAESAAAGRAVLMK